MTSNMQNEAAMQNETSGGQQVKVVEKTGERTRTFRGWLKTLVICVAVAMTLYQVMANIGIFTMVPYAHRAVHLGFALVLVFLLYPWRKKSSLEKISPLDILIILGALSFCLYTFYEQQFDQEGIVLRAGETTALEVILGVIAVVILLEATRRMMGPALPIIVIGFLFYPFISPYLPGILHTNGYSVERIINHIFVSGNGIWGPILGVSATDVFMFVLFSAFFNFSGIGEVFVNVALGWFGGFRGGPAKVCCIGSACFGTISGSAVANILTVGAITIPLMKKIGYAPRVAGAVEAVASTGGMLMPPFMGAAAFVMADYLQIPYGVIIKSAFLPAVLYYLALIFAIDFEAQKKGLGGMPKSELPNAWLVLKKGWHLLTPLLFLIYLLVIKNYSPSRAALYGIMAIIIICLAVPTTRKNWRGLLNALHVGARSSLEVAVTTATVGMVVGIIELTGLGVKLSQMLIVLSHGSLLVLLFLTMIACLILGLGLTPTACYITLAVLAAPTLVKMGVAPLAAHFFVFVYGIIGMITPPVAISAYVAASVAGAELFSTGFTAFMLAMPIYVVPYMFVYGPSLLGIGSMGEVLYTLITAGIGVWAFAAAIQGWIFKQASVWERIIILAAALLLIKPGFFTDIIGAAFLALVIGLHKFRITKGSLEDSSVVRKNSKPL